MEGAKAEHTDVAANQSKKEETNVFMILNNIANEMYGHKESATDHRLDPKTDGNVGFFG